MSYLLTLHNRFGLTLATTDPVVPPEQLAPLQHAFALADALSALLAEQRTALAQAQEEGRAEGHAAGYAAGQERAQEEAAQALAEQIQRIAAEQTAQREELRQALVTLASAMVRRMAADLAPAQVLAALAERAFDHVVPPQPVRLRLPPALLEPVRTQLAQRELPLAVHYSADDSLDGLQCVVESAAGTLLAGLDDMLARTAQSLQTSLRTQASADSHPPSDRDAAPAEKALP